MYPFGSLPENLAAFCAVLRQRHGFRLGSAELQDAARAIEVVNVGDAAAVRHALRVVLSRSEADSAVFDRAFDEFFFGPARRADVEALQSTDRSSAGVSASSDESDRPRERRSSPADGAPDDSVIDNVETDVSGVADVTATVDDSAGPSLRVVRSAYSPIAGEGLSPAIGPPDVAWRQAARSLVARLRVRMSRRWHPSIKGHRFDFRRTLRSSLHTGADPVIPRWRARRRRHPRFLILVDGSRSMGHLAEPALRLAVALSAVTRDVDVFAFSTTLDRITDDVQRAARGARFRLRPLHQAWGGGTRIGESLQDCLARFGDLLRPDTLAIVVSDGLDVGSPAQLGDAMVRLQRRVEAILWINPLIGSPGYAPTAAGMRTARPFVRTFTPLAGPADVLRLARTSSSLSRGPHPSGYDRM